MGNNIACNTNCKCRPAAILYTLETLNKGGGGGGFGGGGGGGGGGDKGMQIIIEFIG